MVLKRSKTSDPLPIPVKGLTNQLPVLTLVLLLRGGALSMFWAGVVVVGAVRGACMTTDGPGMAGVRLNGAVRFGVNTSASGWVWWGWRPRRAHSSYGAWFARPGGACARCGPVAVWCGREARLLCVRACAGMCVVLDATAGAACLRVAACGADARAAAGARAAVRARARGAERLEEASVRGGARRRLS